MPGLSPIVPLVTGQQAQPTASQMDSNVTLKPSYVNTTSLVQIPSQGVPDQVPGHPWMDIAYPSQLPVVPVFIAAVYDSAAPAWGFPPQTNVGDLNVYNGVRKTVLSNITANTQSLVIDLGVQHLDISVLMSAANATCTLNIYQVDPVNGNVLMKTYTGVSRLVTGLGIGGYDGILLSGAQVVIEIINITSGLVTVNIESH